VKVEGDDLRRLMAWVDSNCVYRGMEEIAELPEGRNCLTRSAPNVPRLSPVTDPPAAPLVQKKPK
jgi:hypothetical protein